MMTFNKHWAIVPTLFVAATLIAVGGCAGVGVETGAGAAPTVEPTAAMAEQSAPAGAESSGAAVRELGPIIDMLENGQYQAAQRALQAYLQHDPRSAVAKGLLRQLETDPVQLLGAAHQPYEVRPGDTLGGIAARYLGDPLRFVALARYSGIARPKALVAGQVLKLPVSGKAGVAEPQAAIPLQEVTLQAIEEDLAAGRIAVAQAGIARLRAAGGAPTARLEALSLRARALERQARGLALLEAGRVEEALEALEQALRDAPGLEPATRRRAELRQRLVRDYHEAAVVHFRNQRLDQAIELWDKALALDPGFEPARGYRTRALELRRRLDALE